MEQACSTGAQAANDLGASESNFEAGVHHKIVKFFAILSNRLSAIKAASFKVLPFAED